MAAASTTVSAANLIEVVQGLVMELQGVQTYNVASKAKIDAYIAANGNFKCQQSLERQWSSNTSGK